MANNDGAAKFLRIHSSCSVISSETTPTHSIRLSSIDFVDMLMTYTPVIHLYRTNGDPGFFSAEALRTALSKTLVPFYPYAGEVGNDQHGGVEIKCNGKGVRFVSACYDLTMEEFGDFTPSALLPRVFHSNMPPAKPPCPIAIIQVTRFKCGGVCLGTALHHLIGDGASALHFLNSWADICRGTDPSTIRPPFLDRSLLNPRSPLSIRFPHNEFGSPPDDDFDHGYLPPSTTSTVTLKLSASQVADLKAQGGGKLTASSAVAAHAWRCACKARRLSPNQITRFHIAADFRSRLNPPLPFEFLGNAALPLTVESHAGSTLAEFGGKIELIKTRLNDEYLRSLIDYLSSKREALNSFLPIFTAADVVVVNWLNIPLYDMDFGWGKPCYVNRADESMNGVFHVLRSLDGEKGGVLVTASLEEEFMLEFKRCFYEDLK